jgi:hypothetical protein
VGASRRRTTRRGTRLVRFFVSWYAGQLVGHGDTPVELSAKVPFMHWWHGAGSRPGSTRATRRTGTAPWPTYSRATAAPWSCRPWTRVREQAAAAPAPTGCSCRPRTRAAATPYPSPARTRRSSRRTPAASHASGATSWPPTVCTHESEILPNTLNFLCTNSSTRCSLKKTTVQDVSTSEKIKPRLDMCSFHSKKNS